MFISTDALPATCDFLIVGAGSAGCVLANRLSADPKNRVVLVEAGSRDSSWLIRTPAAVGALMKHPRFNWNFLSTPQPELFGRRIPLPRGRVLGGTSSINGMVYTRGHPLDFDAWAAAGNAGWSYREVLPYFLRSEANGSYAASEFHNDRGPMSVVSIRPHNPLVDAFVAAARSLGYPRCEDFNGADMDGFGPRQATIRKGRRESAATAFLHPVSMRPNLTVLTDCFVNRVGIDNHIATGVELERGGRTHFIGAEREVILSAGSFGSPALLMHSGVGDKRVLESLGIRTQHHLPAVGRNLEDHVAATIMVRTKSPESYGLSWRALPRDVRAVFEYLLFRRGALASNVFEAHGFIRTDASAARPDLQIIFVPAHRNASGFPIPFGHGYGINVALLHPKSRGHVTLASADPRDPPLIDPGFLSASQDLSLLIHGLRLARQILATAPFARFGSHEIQPGSEIQSDAELAEYVRRTCVTVFHPSGTCRMGPDQTAVVDSQLRVKGVSRLRVVDASVFPSLISGNTNAAVIMVAEKASDLVLGCEPLVARESGASTRSQPQPSLAGGNVACRILEMNSSASMK
jgi:Choline dehydrogenase and related flavoproteins